MGAHHLLAHTAIIFTEKLPIATMNAVAGPSSAPMPSSFQAFARSLAESRDLGLPEKLASSSEEGLQAGTALQFAQACMQRAESLSTGALGGEGVSGHQWDHADEEEDRMSWILEARTWELIQLLCADRLLHHPEGEEIDVDDKDSLSQYYQTPLSSMQDVLERDRKLRELKIIREWLSAQLPATHIAEVRKGYMPFSKNRLKAEKRTQFNKSSAFASKAAAIRSLDPDAESRSEGKWDLEDANYSKALQRTLFEYTRAGQLEAAFDLARQADQPWRAASLRGAILYYQALGSPDDLPEVDNGTCGNRNRSLWKAIVRKLATNMSLDPYERALYGSLAGHLSSVLAVSDTWEETLWAHVNSTLERRIDLVFEDEGDDRSWWTQEGGGSVKVLELKSGGDAKSQGKESVQSELRDIFQRLKGSDKAAVHLGADNPYHIVQQSVILDHIGDLLMHVEGRLGDMKASMETGRYAQLLRFFSHLILYLRILDRPLPGPTCNSILRHYVEVLEVAGEDELVAMYASSLEAESAQESYAQYLKSLNLGASLSERRQALLRAKEHSLDVGLVARLVVQIIFEETYPSIAASGALSSSLDPTAASAHIDLSEAEARLIAAVDWLTFDPSTHADAIFQSNALIRLFLQSGRLHAARTLLLNLPNEVLGGLDEMEVLTLGDKTEHLHYRLFFSALSANLSFVEVFSRRPMSTGITAASVSKMELQAWKEALSSAVQTAKEATLEVLTCDWLKLQDDSEDDDDDDDADADDGTAIPTGLRSVRSEEKERRTVDLARVRQLYIPELVLRLHFILFDARNYLVSSASEGSALSYLTADLPVLVADERHRLYLEFVTREGGNRLREYLEHVRKAEVERLGQEGIRRRVNGHGGGGGGGI